MILVMTVGHLLSVETIVVIARQFVMRVLNVLEIVKHAGWIQVVIIVVVGLTQIVVIVRNPHRRRNVVMEAVMSLWRIVPAIVQRVDKHAVR